MQEGNVYARRKEGGGIGVVKSGSKVVNDL